MTAGRNVKFSLLEVIRRESSICCVCVLVEALNEGLPEQEEMFEISVRLSAMISKSTIRLCFSLLLCCLYSFWYNFFLCFYGNRRKLPLGAPYTFPSITFIQKKKKKKKWGNYYKSVQQLEIHEQNFL